MHFVLAILLAIYSPGLSAASTQLKDILVLFLLRFGFGIIIGQ